MPTTRKRAPAIALAIGLTALSGPAGARPAAATAAPGGSGAAQAVRSDEPGRPGSPSFEQEYAEAHKALLKDLLRLASWCENRELYLERDRVYQRILEVDPDNLDARKGLRYARNPDGSWKDPPPREMKNRNPKALEELPKRRAEAVGAFRDRLLALLDAISADPGTREKVHDEILAIDPDDERIHAMRGQAKLGDAWVLAETASGKARRAELKGAIAAALAAVPAAEPAEPTEDERGLAGWTTTIRTEHVRVLATVDAAEAAKIAQACEATVAILKTACGATGALPEGFTVYALREQDRARFVEGWPGLDADERTRLASMPSSGLRTGSGFVSDPDPAKRIDAAVRHTLSLLLADAFHVSTRQGWVWEGVGIYLTREIVGTRYTWYILAAPGAENDSLRGNLLLPKSNWMNEGLQLLDAPSPPDLVEVMSKELYAMKIEDMVAAYVLAAYLVEGRPRETPDLLARLGAGAAPSQAIEAALHLPPSSLGLRVRDWLKERR